MDALRIANELRKQESLESQRLSKDSGVVDMDLQMKPSTSGRLLSASAAAPSHRISTSHGAQARSTSLTDLDKGKSFLSILAV